MQRVIQSVLAAASSGPLAPNPAYSPRFWGQMRQPRPALSDGQINPRRWRLGGRVAPSADAATIADYGVRALIGVMRFDVTGEGRSAIRSVA
jgi:hypothetical protein